MSPAARVVLVLVLAALLLPALAGACPLCKEAEADTPGGSASLARGFYYSILLMIAAPWTAVGTVAFLIFRKRRRSAKVVGTDPTGLHPSPNSSAITPLLPESRGARS